MQNEEERVFCKRTITTKGGQEIKFHVPKSYNFWPGLKKKRRVKDREDCCASKPEVEFDEKSGKWAFTFTGADSEGFDVQDFTYYFDDLNDILEFLEFPLACSCVK